MCDSVQLCKLFEKKINHLIPPKLITHNFPLFFDESSMALIEDKLNEQHEWFKQRVAIYALKNLMISYGLVL